MTSSDTIRSGSPWPTMLTGMLIVVIFVIIIIILIIILIIVKKYKSKRFNNEVRRGDPERTVPTQNDATELRTLSPLAALQPFKEWKSANKGIYEESMNEKTFLDCAICLDTLQDEQEIRGLICKHVFHGACFDQWLQKGHLDCPLCRSSSSANAT